MMKIRPIHKNDIQIVVDLIHKNYDEVMSKIHSKAVIDKFKSELTKDQLKFQMTWKQIFVVESEGEIIATGALVNFGTQQIPKHCVSNFFVRSDLHQQGIGKLLIAHLLKTAGNDGIDRLQVPSSLNAVVFYQSVGFIKDEDQSDMADEITWMTKVL